MWGKLKEGCDCDVGSHKAGKKCGIIPASKVHSRKPSLGDPQNLTGHTTTRISNINENICSYTCSLQNFSNEDYLEGTYVSLYVQEFC